MSKIESRERAFVVSNDPNSPEAKLARMAQEIELQSKADSKYDAILERFESQNPNQTINQQTVILSSIAVILGVVLLASIKSRGHR